MEKAFPNPSPNIRPKQDSCYTYHSPWFLSVCLCIHLNNVSFCSFLPHLTKLCWDHALFGSPFYPQHLTPCLEHSRCSVGSCWVNRCLHLVLVPTNLPLLHSHPTPITGCNFPKSVPLPGADQEECLVLIMGREEGGCSRQGDCMGKGMEVTLSLKCQRSHG